MKLLALFCVLATQYAAVKSWSDDSYSEETFSVLAWIGYLKRLSVIVLMFSGVILYYVPESRPHARRICYALIDFTANGLKSALSARESEYMYEKIKSKYHRAKYELSLLAEKRNSQIRENEETLVTQNHSENAKSFVNNDGLLEGLDKKKTSGKQSKEHRQSRHAQRNSLTKDTPVSSCIEMSKPIYFYSDKLEDLQKYVKRNLSSSKRNNGTTLENYALLISGTPRQMAMLDQKYDKEDVVIVQDPCFKVEYKECGTSTDQFSSKVETSGSEQEGPTRDYEDSMISGIETYIKDVDLCSIPEASTLKHSDYKSSCQTRQYQCCDESYSPNRYSMSSGDMNDNNEVINSAPVADIKNVLKSSRSMVTPRAQRRIEESAESSHTISCSKQNHENRLLKSGNFNSDRRVGFRVQDKEASQRREEAAYKQENTSAGKKKSKNEAVLTGLCCNDISYFTERGGEADDENSQYGLDQRPQRENYVLDKSSDDSIFDFYEDMCMKPILKNRLKPTLLRAVNWIFGGCPEAARRAAMKRNEVGKEKIRGLTDEWLL